MRRIARILIHKTRYIRSIWVQILVVLFLLDINYIDLGFLKLA